VRYKLFLILLIIIGFFFRLHGLDKNYSFWNDEEYVAIFTRAILEHGRPVLANGYSSGIYQWLQYWLSAISAKIFGLNEFALRFPSVVFGILTIWAIFLLGREMFGRNVGLVAAFFTTFLKIEILWSRQVRPYQALQFFSLLGAWFIYKLTKEEKFNWRYFLGFLGSGVSASLMHSLGLMIFPVGFVYLLISRPSWFKKKWILLGILPPVIFGWIFRFQIFSVFSQLGKINNLFYYRVFLWHNYSLLIFLALIGFLSCIFQKNKNWWLLILFLVSQGIIVSFFLPKPFVRYFYIVFPFFVLFSSVGLVEASRLFTERWRGLILAVLVFLIVSLGGKFTVWPQKAYSLNEDMQEIPEVDYQKIYALIKKKLEINPQAVFVSNWNDHPIWYLGEGQPNYLLREKGNSSLGKDELSGAIYIQNLEEFSQVIKSVSQGIILLESWDDVVPQDAREYIRSNLKKEYEIDRLYQKQPRFWPVEVYSWGMD